MTVLAGAAAYPLLAGAQQKAMPVIGFLGSLSPDAPEVLSNLTAFRQGLPCGQPFVDPEDPLFPPGTVLVRATGGCRSGEPARCGGRAG